jgi:hypothetical protein
MTFDLDFNLDDKTFSCYGIADGYNTDCPLNAQELRAVTRQMKELGWIR